MVEEVRHTPGLWFSDIDEFGGIRVGAFGFDTHDGAEILAQVRTPAGVSFNQAKANARLIAAAPDMLSALEALGFGSDVNDEKIGWLGHFPHSFEYFQCEFCKAEHLDCTQIEHKSDCPVVLIRHAVFKARGEQP